MGLTSICAALLISDRVFIENRSICMNLLVFESYIQCLDVLPLINGRARHYYLMYGSGGGELREAGWKHE